MNTNPVFFLVGYRYKGITFMQENGHIYKTKSAAVKHAEDMKLKEPNFDWGTVPFMPTKFSKI